MPPKQVEQRKQENPNNVDEVPVQSNHLDRTVILRIETTPQRKDDQKRQQSGADNHVQRVHAGHREVDPVKHLYFFDSRAGQQVQVVVIERLAFFLDLRTKRMPWNQGSRYQVIFILVVILNSLYPQKRQAQKQGQY